MTMLRLKHGSPCRVSQGAWTGPSFGGSARERTKMTAHYTGHVISRVRSAIRTGIIIQRLALVLTLRPWSRQNEPRWQAANHILAWPNSNHFCPNAFGMLALSHGEVGFFSYCCIASQRLLRSKHLSSSLDHAGLLLSHMPAVIFKTTVV